MGGTLNLNQDFQGFIESFIAHDVRFLIVGGYALAARGHPRYTKDLDVLQLGLSSPMQPNFHPKSESGSHRVALVVREFRTTFSTIKNPCSSVDRANYRAVRLVAILH